MQSGLRLWTIYPVLKISIPKSYSGIVATISGKVSRRRIKADGTPENIPMYPSEFATRLSDLRMLDYSTMPVLQAEICDFDPIETERLRRLIAAYNGDRSLLELMDEDLFKALGFVREQNSRLVPTITGLLMIGKISAVRQYIPTHSAAFQVMTGTDIRVNDDMVLPLLSTIDKINTYLEAWNPEQEMEMGLFRIAIPDFNKRAIREAIVNAFSHRLWKALHNIGIIRKWDGSGLLSVMTV